MALNDPATDIATGGSPAAPPTTAPPPTEEATSVPASSELTAPAAPQVPQLQPEQQAQPQAAPGRHPSFMSHLSPALIGSVLSNLAGPHQAVDRYETDESGKTSAIMRDLHPRERLQRLAQAALEGLAAGSRVGPQASRGGALAAGIGAGAEAQIQKGQQQDLLKRQQAKEDFETTERAKTDNAIRASHLASTYSLWSKAIQENNDHDPERQKNMDVVNAAQDFITRNPSTSLRVDIINAEQAKAIHDREVATLKNDPSHKTKLSTFLPLGMTVSKDENGKPLSETDGTPKQMGQVGVISGGDKAGDNMPLPASFVQDLKEYGKLAGINNADGLTAGLEVPLSTFLMMDSRLNTVKHQEIGGWQNATDAVLPDGETHVQVNSFNQKTRPYPGGITPLGVTKEEADINEKKAGAFEKEQLGKKAQADAEATKSGTSGDMATLLVEGDMDPTQLSKRSKDYNAKIESANKYSMQKYGVPFDLAKAQYDYKYANQKSTQDTLNMIGAITEPGGSLQIAMEQAARLPRMDSQMLNKVFNTTKAQFGDDRLTNFQTGMLGLADEYSKVMGGGVSSDTGRQQSLDMLKSYYSKGQFAGAAQVIKRDVAARKQGMVGTNRYLLRYYGGGIPEGAATATGPNGHKIYTTDSGKTWTDSTTGKPLQ